jgi:hypothetical protein
MANIKFPLQRSKMSRIKGFGENISQLPLCLNAFHLYISLFNMVSRSGVSLLFVSFSHEKLGFGLSI